MNGVLSFFRAKLLTLLPPSFPSCNSDIGISSMDCCLLCPQPLPPPPKSSADEIPDRGPTLPVHGTCDSVHEHCADFAEGVFEVSKQYYFVARAISRSTTPCAYAPCSGTGATSRCAVDGCDKRYHFTCAIYDGAIKVDDGSKFYCADHSHKAPKFAAASDDAKGNEISDGEETGGNAEICFKCSNGGHLVCCDFCENAVHQACAGLVEVPEGEYKCSVCTGDDGISKTKKTDNGNATQGTSEREDTAANYTPLRNTQDDGWMNGTSFMVTGSPGCSDATISPPRDLPSFKKTQPVDDDDFFNVDVPLNDINGNTQLSSNPVITEGKKKVRKSPKLPKPPKQEGTNCFECGLSDDNLMPCDTCNRVVHPDCAGQRGIPISDFSCSVCTGETTERTIGVEQKAKTGDLLGEKPTHGDIDVDTPSLSQGKNVAPFAKAKAVAKKAKSPPKKKKTKTKLVTPKKRVAPKAKTFKKPCASPEADPSPKKRKSPKSITSDDAVINADPSPSPSPKRRRASGSQGNFSWNSWGTKRVSVSAFDIGSQVTPTKSRYVLCATGLNEAQKEMLRNVARRKRTAVRDSIDGTGTTTKSKKVTHMVINAYEEDDAPTRTIKLCKAVAAGVQLVRFKWITDALDSEYAEEWPDVDEYVHQLAGTQEDKRFQGMEFYFGTLRKFADKKGDLADIVKLGGGTVLTKKPSHNNKKLKLMLVEEGNATKGQEKKKGPRRGSLSEIKKRIQGSQIVQPQYILDRCVPQS